MRPCAGLVIRRVEPVLPGRRPGVRRRLRPGPGRRTVAVVGRWRSAAPGNAAHDHAAAFALPLQRAVAARPRPWRRRRGRRISPAVPAGCRSPVRWRAGRRRVIAPTTPIVRGCVGRGRGGDRNRYGGYQAERSGCKKRAGEHRVSSLGVRAFTDAPERIPCAPTINGNCAHYLLTQPEAAIHRTFSEAPQ